MLLLVILCRLLIFHHKLHHTLTYFAPQWTMALSDSKPRTLCVLEVRLAEAREQAIKRRRAVFGE
jgi:hypothetical protein